MPEGCVNWQGGGRELTLGALRNDWARGLSMGWARYWLAQAVHPILPRRCEECQFPSALGEAMFSLSLSLVYFYFAILQGD